MKRLGLSLLVFPVLYSLALADSVMPVLPGYETCSTASGSTICSFNKVTPTTPLPITGTINVSASASGAVATTAAPTYVNNTTNPLSMDLSGNLRTVLGAALPTGANTIGAVTQASGPWTQNVTQFGSNNVVTGTGVSGLGIPRVTVSSDSSFTLLSTPATTTTANSTIAVANTFQTALAASGTRKGCLIQNTSSENMYFYFGTLGSATLANAFQIGSGQSISCNIGNLVLTDAVGVTGPTIGNTYVVTSQ